MIVILEYIIIIPINLIILKGRNPLAFLRPNSLNKYLVEESDSFLLLFLHINIQYAYLYHTLMYISSLF